MATAAVKTNAFKKISKYFKEVRAELKKVVWPSLSKVRRDTITVIVAIIVVGIFVAILDYIFGGILSYLLSLRGGA